MAATRSSDEDDPDSKMFQAKEALYEVLADVRGVNFGFATFPNQDGVRARSKTTYSGIGTKINPRDSSGSTEHCWGWEGNNDLSADDWGAYKQQVRDRDRLPTGLEIGDIVPLNWDDNNVREIQERLAPNLILGETVPNFGVEGYFEDYRTGGRSYLRPHDERTKPFMAMGTTPLGTTLEDFMSWYEAWEDDARANDPEFDCREVFVLMLTDGFETCGGDAADVAGDLLLTTDVETYVIGFAVNNPALNDIALAGGTEEAFFPANKDELVQTFNDIIDDILGQARTFSSAAVPSLQSAAGRNIFLSSFNPVNGASIWPGRLDSYVVPVPYVTTPDGTVVADRRTSAKCSNPDDPDEEGCWAWFAGDELLEQSPVAIDPVTASLSDYEIGMGSDERRVFYGAEATMMEVPADRKCFLPVSLAAGADSQLCDPQTGDDTDLYGPTGMNLPDPTTWDEDAKEVIAETLVQKQGTILNIDGNEEEIDYVLGDIFHSQPTVTSSPNDALLFATSLEGRLEICGPRVDGEPDLYKESYACFAQEHAWRRRMVVAGANDGQLHFFDAGRPTDELEEDPFGNPILTFTAGTGRELFSFVPRNLMPTVVDMATTGAQAYGVDGPVTLGDVGIDPEHNGTPTASDREWRSVLIGGLREGGRAYYALDITKPDRLDSLNRPDSFVGPVPSCLRGGTGCEYPFPMVLWELTDDWDEDGNQAPDMGYTWSQARIGRILLEDGGDLIEKHVAVFGGGLDPDYKRQPVDPDTGETNPWSGNYLYMVDIETGKIIYKRNLDYRSEAGTLIEPAMVPSEPAAVDTDFDTYLDTIYIGTTAGIMYKVDISDPVELATFTVDDWSETDFSDPNPEPIERTVTRIPETEWEPFEIFDTGGRAMYYAPSVVFFSELNQYALAFGAGDREDLWVDTDQFGRFYFILDEHWDDTNGDLPFDESDYELIALDDAPTGTNLIFEPNGSNQPGWIILLDQEERVTAKSLVIAGVVFFNSFVPEPFVPTDGLCAQTGFSRIFAVLATNADGLLTDPLNPGSDPARYQIVDDFATSPYVQSSGTEDELPDDPTDEDEVPDELSDQMEAVVQQLKDLQPEECRFANYTLNVLVDTTASGSQLVAPVPICIIERNFKQF